MNTEKLNAAREQVDQARAALESHKIGAGADSFDAAEFADELVRLQGVLDSWQLRVQALQ